MPELRSHPLKQHILDFIDNQMDPEMPFSDVLDEAIQDAKQQAADTFAVYEAVAAERRNVQRVKPTFPANEVYRDDKRIA